MNRVAKSLNIETNSRTEVIRVGVMHFPSVSLGPGDARVKDATLMVLLRSRG